MVDGFRIFDEIKHKSKHTKNEEREQDNDKNFKCTHDYLDLGSVTSVVGETVSEVGLFVVILTSVEVPEARL